MNYVTFFLPSGKDNLDMVVIICLYDVSDTTYI